MLMRERFTDSSTDQRTKGWMNQCHDKKIHRFEHWLTGQWFSVMTKRFTESCTELLKGGMKFGYNEQIHWLRLWSNKHGRNEPV